MSKVKTLITKNQFIKSCKDIYPYFKPYKKRAVLAILVTIPVGAMDAVIAWALKPYMDVVMIQQSAKGVALIPVLIVLFTVIQSLFNYLSTYLNSWVGNKVTADMRKNLYSKLLTLESSYFDTNTSGVVQQRFNADAGTACTGLLNNVKSFVTKIFSSIALLGVLFYNSWKLAIIASVVLLCAMYPLKNVRKKIKRLMDETVKSSAIVNTHYNEAFSGNKVVASYNLGDYKNRMFNQTIDDVFNLSMGMVKRTAVITPMMHTIISVGVASVIWLGSYLIVKGEITPGNFVSFITALVMLYTPIKAIGNSYTDVQYSFMAIERIFEMLGKIPEIKDCSSAVKLEKINKDIVYENVSFKYPRSKNDVLKNINLRIKVGEVIAFVGNSGGGKTTMVNLLPRFYDVTRGAVRIDGKDIRDFTLYSLREKIAVVFQDNFLFDGTIRDNIVLDRKDISEEALRTAVDNACLSEFVKRLPKGLDTKVGERGVLLSGGQKQRIAIARAFIKNAPIVILDEATSALDNKSEAIVQQAIYNLMSNRTVFIIAHRLSTVKNADSIIVVNNGQIAEKGTHQQLLEKKDSVYASLYKTQLV